jgi:hypothetical protein
MSINRYLIALFFSLCLLWGMTNDVSAQVNSDNPTGAAIFVDIKVDPGQQLVPGQAFTITYYLMNSTPISTSFATTITIQYAATDGGLFPTISGGTKLHLTGNQTQMQYVWSGVLEGNSTVSMTIESHAGQNRGYFEDALSFQTPNGPQSFSLAIARDLPQIHEVSDLHFTETAVITGTNLLDEDGGKHEIIMRNPFNPLALILIKKENTLEWTDTKISFVMPREDQVAAKGLYHLHIQRNTVISNVVDKLLFSNWIAKVSAPKAVAGNEILTYTVSITNVANMKHLAVTELFLKATPFLTDSVELISTAGEIRTTPQSDGSLRILWGVDVQPSETVTLTIIGKAQNVKLDTMYLNVLRWLLPDGSANKADLMVFNNPVIIPEPENLIFLPLVVR